MKNHKKHTVSVGNVNLGNKNNIAVQSMIKKNPHDMQGILDEAMSLEKGGCDLLRLAVPDEESLSIFSALRKKTSFPLIADIHFDYRLATKAIDAGADKIRINPMNLGGEENLKKVLKKAKKARIPIRVGVNEGSTTERLTPEDLANLCMQNVELLNSFDFFDIVVSIKSSSIETTLEANRILHKICPFPIHIGLTEAGPTRSGIVKSTAALLPLLQEGIGDTIRVSLTAPPLLEVKVAREILS